MRRQTTGTRPTPRGDRPYSAAANLWSILDEQRHEHVWNHARRVLAFAAPAILGAATLAVLLAGWVTGIVTFATASGAVVLYVSLRVEPGATLASLFTWLSAGIVILATLIINAPLWWLGVTLAGTWLSRLIPRVALRHPDNEAVTTLTGITAVLLATTTTTITGQYTATAAATVAVLGGWWAWRCRWTTALRYHLLCLRHHIDATPVPRSRRAPGEASLAAHVMNPDSLESGAFGEQTTAKRLDGLDNRWTVLHSRALPGGNADADHILTGPAGLLIVDSKVRTGRLSWSGETDEEGRLVLDLGEAHDLHEVVTPSVIEARRVARGLGIPLQLLDDNPVRSVVVGYGHAFTDPVVTVLVEVLDVHDDLLVWAGVDIVHPDHLVEYLNELPIQRHYRDVSTLQAHWCRYRERSLHEAILHRNSRFWADLGVIADHVFPRRG